MLTSYDIKYEMQSNPGWNVIKAQGNLIEAVVNDREFGELTIRFIHMPENQSFAVKIFGYQYDSYNDYDFLRFIKDVNAEFIILSPGTKRIAVARKGTLMYTFFGTYNYNTPRGTIGFVLNAELNMNYAMICRQIKNRTFDMGILNKTVFKSNFK